MASGPDAPGPDRAEAKIARLDALGSDQPADPVARLDGLRDRSTGVEPVPADRGRLPVGSNGSAAVAGFEDLSTSTRVAALSARVAELGAGRGQRGGRAAGPRADEQSRASRPGRRGQPRAARKSESRPSESGPSEPGPSESGKSESGKSESERSESGPPDAGDQAGSARITQDGGTPRRRSRRAERPAEPAARERTADGGTRGRPELDPDADPVTVAREICLRLLTDRARTRHELGQALQRKGVPAEAAEQVLGRFDEVGLIDDAAFAGQWVRSRHGFRGLGRRAIAMELRRKGVADDVAGEALAEVDAEAEAGRARQLVDRKLRSLTVTSADERVVAARRLVGMLARKGYGAGTAYQVVREALAAHGAEADEFDAAVPLDD